MATRVAYWTDGRQATSADRLRAGIEDSGCGGQAKIAMSRQRRGLRGRGLRGRTDGRAGTSDPAAERWDGLLILKVKSI